MCIYVYMCMYVYNICIYASMYVCMFVQLVCVCAPACASGTLNTNN